MSVLPMPSTGRVPPALRGYSIEVMPRTAQKIARFADLLPQGTRVYIAHIDGTPIDDMVATAARISAEGFDVMPHFPARLIADQTQLAEWIARYQDAAGVRQALLLGGGLSAPRGTFQSAIDLLNTGLFDRAGFTHLHVAGHPEGNRDIDPDRGTRETDAALAWKQGFAEQSDAQMAIVTQFAFESAPIIAWTERLRAQGITLPVHLGIAGPAKLQTLIKFAMACGVGPSVRVLKRRARDVSTLLRPYTPSDLVSELAAHQAQHPDFPVSQLHLFPLGGITAAAQWAQDNGAPRAASSLRTAL